MRCRACGGSLEQVFEMRPMPLAGAFAATRDDAIAATKYPLAWHWCTRCGLVNVAPDIPDEILYATYRYAASQVPALVRHHAGYADFLWNRHRGRIRLLEIGSNDGILLRKLPAGWDLIGVDPADIDSPGIYRIRQPFTLHLAGQLGKFDIITSSNSFAHFSGIEDAIAGVALALKQDGTAYIEVHDLEAALATAQWDTIYHEHKVEWSVPSLAIAFGRQGLRLVDAFKLDLHGGLIRAVFRKGKPKRPAVRRPDFSSLVESYANAKVPDLPEGAVAYGAAGRASVYLNQLDVPVRYVVDNSPLRAGRYVPGVGLRIATPEEFDGDNPPTALITAWNHAADIKARHPGYDRWLTAW